MADFIHDGDAIDYTPSSAVTGGDVVVLGTLVGVAKLDIAANELGALHVKGVFDFPKAVTSPSAIAVGVDLYWDATNEIMTETSVGNTLAGKSVLAATAAATTVPVRLNQ
ncbi:MAG TPA: DUF2190 family protein [Phycisphaerae bacterium]|nr:DUF2190 family protein [Phycisphaerae bacterium]